MVVVLSRCKNAAYLVEAALVGAEAVRDAVGAWLLVGAPRWNGQAVDAEEVADAQDDEEGPAGVHDGREDEVAPQVHEFGLRGDGAKGRAGDGEVGVIDEQGAANHGREHDGPVREGLAREVREDDLGGHATEDEGHGQAVEHEVVVLEDEGIWRAEPGDGGSAENDDRCPLPEDWQDGEVLGAAGASNVDDAGGEVSDEECGKDQRDPEVSETHVTKPFSEAREVGDQGHGPDLGAKVPRHADEGAGKDETLCGGLLHVLHTRVVERTCRAIEVAEIERVGVVRLPGGEEHGQHWDEGSECTNVAAAITHGCCFEQAREGAIQRIDAVAVGISHVFVALGCTSRTQTVLPAGLTCLYDAPAFHLHCPWWSTFLSVSESRGMAADKTHIHMPNAKL